MVDNVARYNSMIGYAQRPNRAALAAIIRRRLSYIDEEATELREAMEEAAALVERGSKLEPAALTQMVQELIDLAYVITGTFIELGMDPAPAWRAIHDANTEPEGWQPPGVSVEK